MYVISVPVSTLELTFCFAALSSAEPRCVPSPGPAPVQYTALASSGRMLTQNTLRAGRERGCHQPGQQPGQQPGNSPPAQLGKPPRLKSRSPRLQNLTLRMGSGDEWWWLNIHQSGQRQYLMSWNLTHGTGWPAAAQLRTVRAAAAER